MRKTWAICNMEIQRLLKKRQSYLLMFALPLLFTLIFGSLLGDVQEDKLKILLIDQDQTALSGALYEQLHDQNSLFDIQKSSAIEAENILESKEIPGAIVISKGFQQEMLEGKMTSVTFQRIPEFTDSTTITQYLSNTLAKLNIEVTASSNWSEYTGEAWEVMYDKIENQSKTIPLPINKVNIDEKKSATQMNGMSARASGFSIMFVMIMMMSVTGTILEARQNGVWYRMLTMPASKLQITLGYLLSFFLIGWIQFGVLMISTHFMFNVNWGDPLAVGILVSAMLFAIVGLGLMIAGMVKTVEQQSSVGNLVVVATCMISGVYWPIEIEPVFMQKMAEFFPQTWAMRGFTELIANGGTLFDILDCVGILLGFALLFLIIGMRKMRFE